jgi:hypothetical protein
MQNIAMKKLRIVTPKVNRSPWKILEILVSVNWNIDVDRLWIGVDRMLIDCGPVVSILWIDCGQRDVMDT